ncbi:hypothetical protein [Halobacteriovorax sp. HLS]|uniref:hypothetical protein n=1 Tax=Halobacteriovorax sp. HLS TaxID=2234000 RepID=UPI000FD86A33|nr:hypothetical protein [Halobacteriovorax sp. HLS]
MKNFLYTLFLLNLCLHSTFAMEQSRMEFCENEAITYFKDAIAKDESNILAKQYELTMLKLARASASENRATLEEYIKKVTKDIDANDPKLKKIDELYKKYGHKEDLKKVLENFRSANHWSTKTRFYNDDVSAFIILAKEIDPSLGLEERDASIVWFMNSVQAQAHDRFGKGSVSANKINLTNRLNKYTGAIAGKRSLTDSEFFQKIEKLKEEIDNEMEQLHQNFLVDFNSECFDGALFAGSCYYSQNDTNFLFSSALKGLTSQINQQEIVGLKEDIFNLKGLYKINLLDQPSYREYQREAPLSLIPPKLDYTSIADIRIHDSYWVNQKEVKKLEDKLNILSDHKKIMAFHEHADNDNYIILDKVNGIINIYAKSGALIESKKVNLLGSLADKVQSGGAGSYTLHSVKNGIVYIQDDRGNVRPLEGVKLDSRYAKTPLYILPSNADHHFKIKGGKIHFTTKGKKSDYIPYNFSKKDGEVRKLKSVITNKKLQTKTSLKFMETIDKEKSTLISMYGLTNHEYNELSKLAFGILGNESKFGDSNKYWLKEAAPYLVSVLKGNGLDTSRNSRGPTQIKTVPKKIKSKFGVTKSSLEKPRDAALATMGFLANALDELKAKEKFHPGINAENRFEYIHYIYMGKSKEITKATATPHKNIYYNQIKDFNKSLEIYERID